MSRLNIITRADDIGSSHSANLAACMVAKAGFIKNFSLMAPGPFIEEAAQMLASHKDICLGMHTTLNAEWDGVKWKPVLSHDKKSGLVDDNGYFLANPLMFAETKPPLEIVIAEVEAQFERLVKLGLDIKYIDSHMFPELFIDGLDEAIAEFAKSKGLIDHMYYYSLPPGFDEFLKDPSEPTRFLKSIPSGQYFIVVHPSLDTEEMRASVGESNASSDDVVLGRARETRVFSGKLIKMGMRLAGCRGIRYDEAGFGERATVDDVRAFYLKDESTV